MRAFDRSASRSISKDMVPFDIPVTFTITPHDPTNDKVGFLRYAQRMNGLTEAEYHTILTGIIHGQTRILAGEKVLLFADVHSPMPGCFNVYVYPPTMRAFTGYVRIHHTRKSVLWCAHLLSAFIVTHLVCRHAGGDGHFQRPRPIQVARAREG